MARPAESILFQKAAEMSWKQKITAAGEQEQRWIAEALPKHILDAEIKRRTDLMLSDIQDYMRLAIRVSNEEQRRMGAI